MPRRRRRGDYEPLVLYDEPTAMDVYGHVRSVEAGGTPVFVENFQGALRPISAREAERGGLDAGRSHEMLECRKRESRTVDRIVYRTHTNTYYRISEVLPVFRDRTMTARLERLTLAKTDTKPT